jgi:hypothetical protein
MLFRLITHVLGTNGVRKTKKRYSFQPSLEVLENRLSPVVNEWIAPPGATAWEVGTNWSRGVKPTTDHDVVFDKTMSNSPCVMPANLDTNIQSLKFNDFAGTLTLNSNLTTGGLELNPRTHQDPGDELIISAGKVLRVNGTSTFKGGSITGDGTLLFTSNTSGFTVFGTTAADKPTLGVQMNVGDGTTSGGLVFAEAATVPLVVKANANITVTGTRPLPAFFSIYTKPQGTATTVTVISNADTLPHTITIGSFGQLSRANHSEAFVATGLTVTADGLVRVVKRIESGQAYPAGPLHFTEKNADAYGLTMTGGTINVEGDLMFEEPGTISGGQVTVQDQAVLTFANRAATAGSTDVFGDQISLKGKIWARGGFVLGAGGILEALSPNSIIDVDPSYSFVLDGGTVKINPPNVLTIDGDMTGEAGVLEINVSSTMNQSGKLKVIGNLDVVDVTLSSLDRDNPNPVPTVTYDFVEVTGTRSGDFFYLLPQNWEHQWVGGILKVTEKP